MPIKYALIAEGSDILAEDPTSEKQLAETSRAVLSKIERKNQKRTLTHGGVNYHLKYSGSFLYICVADADYPLRVCYAFLDDIEKTSLSNPRNLRSILRSKIAHYNDPQSDDISRVRGQLNEVSGVMMDNIDKVLERGVRLEDMADKTQTLREQGSQFSRNATSLKRHFCLRNAKMTFILVVICLVVLFFIIVAGCGGFSFPRCS